MKKILATYRIINILSLDVAAGAVVSASFFARIFNVTILPQGLISLGLTVWIIYTADHLLDAKKMKQAASTERHRFHQQHFTFLFIATILALLVDVTQIYFIRNVVFIAGLGLSLVVAIYFLVQHKLGFLKEILGTLLYTGGVLLIPLSVKNILPLHFILLILQFGLTAWINLLLFSWIDRHVDELHSHRSFTTTFGEGVTQKILTILFMVNGALAIIQLIEFPFVAKATETILLMNAFLLLIFLRKEYFEKEDRYRLLGDAIFLFPVIYILI